MGIRLAQLILLLPSALGLVVLACGAGSVECSDATGNALYLGARGESVESVTVTDPCSVECGVTTRSYTTEKDFCESWSIDHTGAEGDTCEVTLHQSTRTCTTSVEIVRSSPCRGERWLRVVPALTFEDVCGG